MEVLPHPLKLTQFTDDMMGAASLLLFLLRYLKPQVHILLAVPLPLILMNGTSTYCWVPENDDQCKTSCCWKSSVKKSASPLLYMHRYNTFTAQSYWGSIAVDLVIYCKTHSGTVKATLPLCVLELIVQITWSSTSQRLPNTLPEETRWGDGSLGVVQGRIGARIGLNQGHICNACQDPFSRFLTWHAPWGSSNLH